MQTESVGQAERPGSFSFIFSADGLGRVLDDGDAPLFCRGHDGVHVGSPACQMHGHDGFGARRDLRSQLGGVHVHIIAHIREYGFGAERGDGGSRGQKGIGSGDDLISRSHARDFHGQEQTVGPGIDANGKARAAILGETLFQFLDTLAQDEIAVLKDAVHSGQDVLPQGPVLLLEIDVGDFGLQKF